MYLAKASSGRMAFSFNADQDSTRIDRSLLSSQKESNKLRERGKNDTNKMLYCCTKKLYLNCMSVYVRDTQKMKETKFLILHNHVSTSWVDTIRYDCIFVHTYSYNTSSKIEWKKRYCYPCNAVIFYVFLYNKDTFFYVFFLKKYEKILWI